MAKPAKQGAKKKAKKRKRKERGVTVFVGTRKGLWTLSSDASRRAVAPRGAHHVGLDRASRATGPARPRDTADGGAHGTPRPDGVPVDERRRTWKEASSRRRSRRREARAGARGRSRRSGSRPGTRASPASGTRARSPQGLFRSEDGGVDLGRRSPASTTTRAGDVGRRRQGRDARRRQAALDPRRPARPEAPLPRHVGRRHLRVHRPRRRLEAAQQGRRDATSCRRTRRREYGHDPHCVRAAPARPDRLWQQNHCGIYRHRPAGRPLGAHRRTTCRRTSATSASRSSLHPRDPDTAWVFPMDGTRRLAAHEPRRASPRSTRRATPARAGSGTTPACRREQAWWTVKRQAMTADDARSGRPLLRHDRAASCGRATTRARACSRIARHLPHIYSVTRRRA